MMHPILYISTLQVCRWDITHVYTGIFDLYINNTQKVSVHVGLVILVR